jgi:hypothetical protein
MYKKCLKLIKNPLIVINVIIITGTLMVIVLAIIESVDYGDVNQKNFFNEIIPSCVVKSYTGVDCPSCGLTRGFYSIFDGQFKEAYDYNRVTYPILLIVIILLVNSIYYLIKKRYPEVLLKILFITIGIMVIIYIYNTYEFIIILLDK